jgi:hypothetical protein
LLALLRTSGTSFKSKLEKKNLKVEEMSEFPWDSTFAIIGVIVGFSLSQVANLVKSETRKRTIKKALVNELLVIKDSISYASNNSGKLPKDRLPLITEIYDTSKSKLASILKPKQLLAIQRAYAQIKQVGSPMSSGNTLFRGYIEIPTGDHVIYQHNLKDEIPLLEQAIAELK